MFTNVAKERFGIFAETPSYFDTEDGLGFVAKVYMDENLIGTIENEGRGGITWIRFLNSDTQIFEERMNKYFREEMLYTLDNKHEVIIFERFAHHLLDYAELGMLSDYNMDRDGV